LHPGELRLAGFPYRRLMWLFLALGLGLSQVPALAQHKAAAKPRAVPESQYDTPQQAALLRKQVAALAPQKNGVTDVYVIGLAGWAGQEVFRKELTGALAVTGKVLPVEGKVLRLVNSKEASDVPFASRKNFAAAVRGVGRVMNKDEDVLVLFMTSHGAAKGFGLQLPGSVVALTPAEVAGVLKREGIKNRMVIVSACYSGTFIKPLVNNDTIIMTAADEKSASFGCSDKRSWTYFGDALFHSSLKPGIDLQIAFANARGLIRSWERYEGFPPSNPQAHFGPALTRKLAPLIAAMGEAEANK